MKDFIILSLLIISCIHLGFTQNYKIEYKASIVGYTLNSESGRKLSKPQRSFIQNLNRKNEILSELLTIEVTSNLDTYVMTYKDVMLIDGLKDSDLTIAKLSISNFLKIYYVDDKSFGFSSMFNDVLVESISENYFKWKISQESKKILGYKCLKAIPVINEGFKVPDKSYIPDEIWFTPELNFKASPAVFADVPGAILEYNTGRALIKAISVNQSNQEIGKLSLDNYEIVSYNEFNEKIRNRSNRMFNN